MNARALKKEDRPIVFESEKDVPPLAISLGTTLFNKTGSWKNIEPFYMDKMPPCNNSCPAGEDIVLQLWLTKERRFKEAVEILKSETPFPATCGRVCPRFCERECNRKEFDGSVAIRAEERFLGDYALKIGWRPRRQRRRRENVAVVGSGPAGLSCAHFLAVFGYSVTVFEARPKPGGMMRVGIPSYRLPRDVLDAEIEQIVSSGLRIECGARLGESLTWRDLSRFDATCLATGFHKSRPLGIPGEEMEGVLSGVDLLRSLAAGRKVRLGKKVGIIGGGNTAVDVARSVLRLGRTPIVIYRRTREEMPAIAEEVDDAVEEGVTFHFLASPVKVIGRSGKISQLECIKTRLGSVDETGRRRPIPVRHSNFRMKVDNLVRAIGEEADTSFMPDDLRRDWRVMIDKYGMTSMKPVFACGDVATGEGTVAHAIGSGKSAAVAIDRFLRGVRRPNPHETIRFSSRRYDDYVTRFDDLNLDYFERKERLAQARLALSRRKKGFKEVNLGFDAAGAAEESERCFTCGTCNLCENCLIYCPDLAVRWKRGRKSLSFSYEFCKGCGICSEECPRDAIEMREVLRGV
ncbi:MAG: NAD(P)-binding protein [bacterium]